jgi:signal transduction histidine kinase
MTIEKRILVIDDEERMADSVRELLSHYGYVVEVAYGGAEGIRKLQESSHYQVVITDVRMPDVDGYEVMRFLHERQPHVFVIVITGHASTESAIEAIHYRAFDYLQKPFEFDRLRECIERAFNRIEADHMREDWTSMITHDIKIPLSSIIGFAALVFDKQGAMHPRGKEFVRLIQLNAEKIRALIDNFNTTCKIEAGKLQLFRQELNLQHLLDELMAVMAMDIERQGLRYESAFDASMPIIVGDEHLLMRALGNIVSNAIKYTPDGGTVRVATRRVAAENSPIGREAVQVMVANSGPGIAKDDLATIFEKYRRSTNIRGIEGSGIGLYVVKFVVDHHDGYVELASEPNKLTTFTLTLPLKTME